MHRRSVKRREELTDLLPFPFSYAATPEEIDVRINAGRSDHAYEEKVAAAGTEFACFWVAWALNRVYG